MKKKITVLAAMAVMLIGAAGLLSACGDGGVQITDAQSLAAANEAAQAGVENYHMDMDMNMEMSVKMDTMKEIMGTDTLTMPMEMKMNMDSGKETAHATTTSSMSLMGQSLDQNAELYIDIANGVTYTQADGSDSWLKSEIDSSMSDMMTSLEEMGEETLAQAAFAETEDGYTLTLDAKVMGEAVKKLNLFSNYKDAGMELKEFDISSGEIVYTFDKQSALISKIEMKELDVKAQGDMSGTTLDMQIPISATFDYSKYGELDAKDYEIPADVISAAGGGQTEKATEAATQPAETTQATQPSDTGQYLPKAEHEIILDGSHTPGGQGWFVVGKDSIPAGTYKLFHGAGEGILTLQDMNQQTQNGSLGSWSIGYEYKDELEDGTQVTLMNGDDVFITDGLQVLFDPVN